DDLTLFAYSPTFKGSYDTDERWEQVRRAGWADAANEERRQRVQKAAAELGCTANQLVLAWMMRQPRTSPIFGVRTWDQYAENVAAADLDVPDALLEELDAA